jgi:4-carboxymuconolactone decarboxylase
MPRVPPITGKADVPAEHHGVVDDVLGVFGRIRGPFSVLLYSPEMAGKLLPMVPFNRDGTIVEPNPRFAGILAAVREREGAYVWAAQVAAAQRAGVPQSMIDLLRAKGDPASLSDDEADVVTYIRQLMRTNHTDRAVFDRLKERRGVQWLVELTAIASYYAMLCGLVNAFEVDVPEDGDRLPA